MNDERVFLYGGWNRARRTILESHTRAADGERPHALVLLGAAGSGKTMLLRRLAHIMTGQGKVVRLATGTIPADMDATDVLLVDDAERLDDAALSVQLTTPACFCVLAIQSESASRLTEHSAHWAAITLNPMRPAEAREFVAARFAKTGQPAALSEASVAEIARLSGGVPGRIVQLVDAAVRGDTGAPRLGRSGADPAPQNAAEPARHQAGICPPADEKELEPPLPTPARASAPPQGAPAALQPCLPPMAAFAAAGTLPADTSSPLQAETAGPPPRMAVPAGGPRLPPVKMMTDAVFEDAIWSDLGVKHGSPGPGAGPEVRRGGPVLSWPAATAGVIVLASAALLWIAGHEFLARMPVQRDARRLNEQMLAASAKTALRHSRPTGGEDATTPDLAEQATTPPPATLRPEAAVERPPVPAGLAAVAQTGASTETPARLAAETLSQNQPQPAVAPAAMAELAAIPSVFVGAQSTAALATATAAPVAAPAPGAVPSGTLPTQAPGLVLVARAGDTLPELYRKVYRGVEAPPYSVLVAANPAQIKPGTALIFPPPPHGWGAR